MPVLLPSISSQSAKLHSSSQSQSAHSTANQPKQSPVKPSTRTQPSIEIEEEKQQQLDTESNEKTVSFDDSALDEEQLSSAAVIARAQQSIDTSLVDPSLASNQTITLLDSTGDETEHHVAMISGGGNSEDALPAARSIPRATDRQNECISLLSRGCIQSFIDLFYLTHRSNQPVNDSKQSIPSHQLPVISAHLSRAESSHRTGDLLSVYTHYAELASLLTHTMSDSSEAAVYFHQKCFATARNMNDTQLQVQTLTQQAAVHESVGQYDRSMILYENARNLMSKSAKGSATDDKKERSDVQRMLRDLNVTSGTGSSEAPPLAHDALLRIYASIASSHRAKGADNDAISFYRKMLLVANESGSVQSKQAQLEALYCLGVTYTEMNVDSDAESSSAAYDCIRVGIEYLKQYQNALAQEKERLMHEKHAAVSNSLSSSQASQVTQSLARLQTLQCQCHFALAKASLRLRDSDAAVQELLLYYDLSMASDSPFSTAQACNQLGCIYLARRDFAKAVEYFEKCFKHARQIVQSRNGAANAATGTDGAPQDAQNQTLQMQQTEASQAASGNQSPTDAANASATGMGSASAAASTSTRSFAATAALLDECRINLGIARGELSMQDYMKAEQAQAH